MTFFLHCKRAVYNNKGLPQKQEKTQKKQLALYLMEQENEKQNKTKNRKSIRRKEIKIRAEVNDIEPKKIY